MPDFRCAFFARDYEASLAFYGDGLGLETVDSWARGPDDRGTLFTAASGIIEVLALPHEPEAGGVWDRREPAGVTLVIEVSEVDRLFERVVEKGLTVKEPLTEQPWGHRSFVLEDPDGVSLYCFSKS